MSIKKTNKLPDAIEQNRLQVIDLEMKARFWRAQWEIRYYTLKAEKLQPEYDEWAIGQTKKNEEAQKRFEEQMQKLQESGAEVNVNGQAVEETELNVKLQQEITEEQDVQIKN